MHPRIFHEFERICSERHTGDSVLEIGAVPSDDSLLCMESLKNARLKVGINIDGPYTYKDFEIFEMNANDMSYFNNEMFDTVVSNAVLEHDRFFWKTISEMKRVIRPGGLIVIAVPGYRKLQIEKIFSRLERVSVFRRFLLNPLGLVFSSTLTFQVHNHPGDFYRFSPQAVREVFFEGMRDVDIYSVMIPPRIIGAGIKA